MTQDNIEDLEDLVESTDTETTDDDAGFGSCPSCGRCGAMPFDEFNAEINEFGYLYSCEYNPCGVDQFWVSEESTTVETWAYEDPMMQLKDCENGDVIDVWIGGSYSDQMTIRATVFDKTDDLVILSADSPYQVLAVYSLDGRVVRVENEHEMGGLLRVDRLEHDN